MVLDSFEKEIAIPVNAITLRGDLIVADDSKGVILFAHGSGSSRLSPRNRYIAGVLRKAGFSTLLFDLLTEKEEEVDAVTAEYRFNTALLASRLLKAVDWARKNEEVGDMKVGFFGASTGAAAALIAAAERPEGVFAVVSRGGRPDMAREFLKGVKAPTLLVVGGEDKQIIDFNKEAMSSMKGEKEMVVVPGATHLFPETGKLEEVARLAREWFLKNA